MVADLLASKTDRTGVVVRAALMVVLAFSPLAFGAVHSWAYGICWGVLWGAVSLWFGKMWMELLRSRGAVVVPLLKAPFFWFLLGFGLWVFMQCVYMPGKLVQWIQPSTFSTYQRIAEVGVPLPKWMPLTLYRHGTMRWALTLWTAGAIMILMLYHVKKRVHLWSFAALWMGLGLFESMYGMVGYLKGSHRIWWWESPFVYGVTGTFINRDHLAGFLEMTFLVSLGLLLARRKAGSSRRLSFRAKVALFVRDDAWAKNLLLLFFCVLIGTGLLLSLSRGAAMATLVVILPVSLLFTARRQTRWYGLAGIGVSLASVLYAGPLGLDELVNRFGDILKDVKSRQDLWAATVEMARNYPVAGIGGGVLEWVFPRFKPEAFGELIVTNAHNDWLEVLAETGVLGFGLVLGAFSSYLTEGVLKWRGRRDHVATWFGFAALAAVAAIGFHSLGEFLLRTQANLFTLAGVTGWGWVALHHRKRCRRVESVKLEFIRISMPRWTAMVMLGGLCLFQIWIGAKMALHLAAESMVPTERNSTVKRLPTRDMRTIARSISLDPENSARWAKMAEEVLAQGTRSWMQSWAEAVGISPVDDTGDGLGWARAILWRALRLNPTSAELYGKLGWVLASRESWRREGLAEKALRIALYMDPSNGRRHFQLGHFLLLEGRIKEAKAAFERALELSPQLKALVDMEWRSMEGLFSSTSKKAEPSLSSIWTRKPAIK